MTEKWFNMSVEDAVNSLNTDVENGLTLNDVKSRRDKYCFNELQAKKKKSIFVKFLEQFKDFMIIILIISAIISGVVGVMEGEGITDTIIILVVVVVNAIRAGAKTLVISLKTYPKSYHKSFVINDDNAFDKAIEQTVAHITNFMQNKISSVNDNSGDIVVTADVNLKGWLEIEKKLNHIAQIKATGIKSAKVGKIGFWVKYSGSISELIENMAQNGLYLQINDNQYTLSI